MPATRPSGPHACHSGHMLPPSSTSRQLSPGTADAIGSVRWRIVGCAFVVAAVSYLDRNNISIAASLVQRDFDLTNVQLGAVFSAFVLGYALAQPLAGHVADRFGAYRCIAVGVMWWSAFTVLTALVPHGMAWSLAMLLLVRFLLGVGEAVIFPASNRLIANWIPSKERGLANGIVFAGVGVGGGLAPPLITFIMLTLNWRWAFYVSALIGIVVGLIWIKAVTDHPKDHKAVLNAEREYIEEGIRRDPWLAHESRWRDILFERQPWLLACSYFCFGYVAYIYFTWFFKYLSEIRGLDLKASALYAALPFVAMALASSLGGMLSDRITRRVGARLGRCGLAALGLFLTGVLVWLAARSFDARTAALILTCGAGALYLAQSSYWAVSADVGGAAAGRLSSIMNMGGQIGGIATASLTPLIADRLGWAASFTTAAYVAIAGAAFWALIDPNKPLALTRSH